jgi:hypothetical protein
VALGGEEIEEGLANLGAGFHRDAIGWSGSLRLRIGARIAIPARTPDAGSSEKGA